jgi:hypothetical protein
MIGWLGKRQSVAGAIHAAEPGSRVAHVAAVSHGPGSMTALSLVANDIISV